MGKADPAGTATCWELLRLMASRLWQAPAPLCEARGVLSWLPPWEPAPCPCFAPRPLWSCHILHLLAMDPGWRQSSPGGFACGMGAVGSPGELVSFRALVMASRLAQSSAARSPRKSQREGWGAKLALPSARRGDVWRLLAERLATPPSGSVGSAASGGFGHPHADAAGPTSCCQDTAEGTPQTPPELGDRAMLQGTVPKDQHPLSLLQMGEWGASGCLAVGALGHTHRASRSITAEPSHARPVSPHLPARRRFWQELLSPHPACPRG